MLPSIYRSDADNRKHQINTLKIFNDNVSEIEEGTEYKIAFTAGGKDFSLYVTLCPTFPQERPVIRISPPVSHHWVNAEGDVIFAPGLLNYTIHSDLGRVVQAIIREFERNPPPLASEGCVNNISPSKPSDNVVNTGYSISFPTLSNFSTASHMPVYSGCRSSVIFPDLNNLSLEELQFLNENFDRQQEYIDEIPQIKEQNKILDELIDNLQELADNNLAKQERLVELRHGIEKRTEQATKLAFDNETLHSKYISLCEKYAPRKIQGQLRKAAEKADSESEKVAEAFLNGKIDVESFVSKYLKTRTLCQTRKTKEEKLSQQLDKLEKAGY